MKVHCSKGVLSSSCELCRSDDDNPVDTWCNGNCYFNEDTGTCKEGIEEIKNF